EVQAGAGWSDWLGELASERRAAQLEIPTVIPAQAGIHSSTSLAMAEVDPGLRRDDGRIWVAAERLPLFAALWPEARLDPPITAPASQAERVWSPEEALVEILRGRLEGLGPVSEAALAAPFGLTPYDIAGATMTLSGA